MSRACRESLCCIALICLCGCAALTNTQDEISRDQVRVAFEAVPGSGIPAFTATVRVQSSISEVMTVLTDFAAWPRWVYGSEQVTLLQAIGFTGAYVYQVTRLPLVRDRDVIMHATISSVTPGKEVVVKFELDPDYCEDSERESCAGPNNSKHVRLRELSGFFRITRVARGEVEIIWHQHMDPGGMLPDWIVRVMQPRVPIQSLSRLKAFLES